MNEPVNPYEPSHELVTTSDQPVKHTATIDRVARGCLGILGLLAGIASLCLTGYGILFAGFPGSAMSFIVVISFLGLTCLVGGRLIRLQKRPEPRTNPMFLSHLVPLSIWLVPGNLLGSDVS